MKTFTSIKTWTTERKTWNEKSIGFVPTMGALHAGHCELVRRSNELCEKTIVSIFVNPTQFNDPNDLEKYPRTIEADIEILSKYKVDALILPTPDQIYFDNYKYKISENDFSNLMEGAHRPGHFDGVLTVVMKLFQLANPSHAFFGEKDFQQLKLIQGMVDAFFLPIEIVPVPTARESNGLAMSSRNVRISEGNKALAPMLYATIKESSSAEVAKAKLTKLGFNVDYVIDYNNRRLVAAKLGEVRLIDNIKID